MSYYIHQTPGRLRVRTPAIKNCEATAAHADRVIMGLRGVHDVRCNPLTGSITIEYDAEFVSPALLINKLTDLDLLTGIIGFPSPAGAQRARRVVSPLGRHQGVRFSPTAKRMLGAAAKFLLPILAERALGKPGRMIVSAFL